MPVLQGTNCSEKKWIQMGFLENGITDATLEKCHLSLRVSVYLHVPVVSLASHTVFHHLGHWEWRTSDFDFSTIIAGLLRRAWQDDLDFQQERQIASKWETLSAEERAKEHMEYYPTRSYNSLLFRSETTEICMTHIYIICTSLE